MTSGDRSRVEPEVASRYHEAGWWGDDTVGSIVAARALVTPDAIAFIADVVGTRGPSTTLTPTTSLAPSWPLTPNPASASQ